MDGAAQSGEFAMMAREFAPQRSQRQPVQSGAVGKDAILDAIEFGG
jgi:hypothetical protein